MQNQPDLPLSSGKSPAPWTMQRHQDRFTFDDRPSGPGDWSSPAARFSRGAGAACQMLRPYDPPSRGELHFMVQRTKIQFIDDLDGRTIADGKGETVGFSLDGASYEIDLKSNNAAALRKALMPYIAAGRRVPPARRVRRRKTSNVEETRRIKAWARENGFEVASRGRVSQQVRTAYTAAEGSTDTALSEVGADRSL